MAQEGARRSLPGDGPVRAAEEALTRWSRRHSAWAARRLAPGASTRPPSGCSAGDAWVWEGGEGGEGAGGVLVRAGKQDAGDHNRAAPTAMSMPFLAWSCPCQCRHRHRSLCSELQKRSGSRHFAPNFKTYKIAEQTFCKFGSWSDQQFQKTVRAKTRVCCLDK